MDEWQPAIEPEKAATSVRAQWFLMLGMALEQIEEKFIMGNIDRDEYLAQVQELDAKLAIVGLTLVNKPWLKGGTRV